MTRKRPPTAELRGWFAIAAVVTAAVLTSVRPVAAPVAAGQCPLSQGYWKNHPGVWPLRSLVLGNATNPDHTYTQGELLALLQTAARGDASVILADQLIAAKLNVANGSNP